jgi:hypothetical protein
LPGPASPPAVPSAMSLPTPRRHLPHDLRHTHATQLLGTGVYPKVVSECVGHASIGITLDNYSQVMPGMQAGALVKIVQNGWAYQRPHDSTAERIAALPGFLTYDNGYRPHSGLDGDTLLGRLTASAIS